MRFSSHRQGGFSTFVAIAAIVCLGIIFFGLFMLSLNGGNKSGNNSDQQSGTEQEQPVSTSNEPPYIRIPENSKIYQSTTYGFSFAYPDSFGELAEITDTSAQDNSIRVESALAAQKPIGNGTAFMNGRLSVLTYSKDDFKVSVTSDDVSVAPTKTGDDITWKVVSRGSSTQDLTVGSSYTVKSVKSQTGITVFDFTYKPAGNFALGRWVFASGDNYIMIALPSVSKPSGESLTDADISAYTIIGNNIAKSVRVPNITSGNATN